MKPGCLELHTKRGLDRIPVVPSLMISNHSSRFLDGSCHCLKSCYFLKSFLLFLILEGVLLVLLVGKLHFHKLKEHLHSGQLEANSTNQLTATLVKNIALHPVSFSAL